MKNLANILTIGRLLLLPPIIILFYIPTHWAAWLCFWLYVIGAVTDFLDGWVARKFDQISDFGKFMDPVSDKIFVITLLLMLVAVGRIESFWVVTVVVILAREFLVSGMREFLGPKNIKLPVTKLAKWKTTVQMSAIAILIVGEEFLFGTFIGELGLSIAAILTIITGWSYLKVGFAHMKD